MKNFTENTRVQVPAALHLCKLGYTYLDDITSYNPQTNILTEVFLRFCIHRTLFCPLCFCTGQYIFYLSSGIIKNSLFDYLNNATFIL